MITRCSCTLLMVNLSWESGVIRVAPSGRSSSSLRRVLQLALKAMP